MFCTEIEYKNVNKKKKRYNQKTRYNQGYCGIFKIKKKMFSVDCNNAYNGFRLHSVY